MTIYFGHPYDCTSRKFPFSCPLCSATVIYWECYHGSKVWFDPPDQGEHNCSTQSPLAPGAGPLSTRRSGREASPELEGVTESVEPANFGLLPGMTRVPRNIADELAQLWTRRSDSRQRDTVQINPLGEKRESVFGDVSEIVEIDLRTRFDIGDGSVLARTLSSRFPNLRVTQVTILVDDILNDPDAVDVMSYTAWCPQGTIPSGLARGDTIDTVLVPVELLGVGRRWLVESIERL